MKKVFVVTSGKGGVGKTTTAINLGAAMNYFGKNVLIVDANLSTPNIGIHLGSPEVPINLNHVMSDNAGVFEAIYEHDSGMKILPSSLSINDLDKIKPSKLKNFKNDFKEVSDIVIIDSAAGLNEEAKSAIEMADELVIVTNADMLAITDALKAIKVAEKMKKDIRGVIVTKVKKDKIEMTPDLVKNMLEVPILGMIPEDDYVRHSLNSKDAVVHVYPKSRSARAYKEIAAKMLEVPYDSKIDEERLIKRVLQKLGFVRY